MEKNKEIQGIEKHAIWLQMDQDVSMLLDALFL